MSNHYPFPSRTPMRVSFLSGLTPLVAFGLVPALAVVAVSFTDIRGLPGIPVRWVGVANYVKFASPAHLGDNVNAIENTLIFGIVTTVVQIVLALAIAVLVNQKIRGRNFYRSVVFMPTVLGVTVIGLIWSLVFNPSRGPAAGILAQLGRESAFFGDPSIALGLIMFVQVWSVLGISVVIFLAGLQAIPGELYEVAGIDGANAGQKFRHVTVPMLAPSITANVLLGIVSALQSYQLTYVLTGANNPSTQLLSLLVYVQGFGGAAGSPVSQSQGYASAISVVQFLIVGVIAVTALVYLRKREDQL